MILDPTYQEALKWSQQARQNNAKICFTSGVYDIITAGHINFLTWLSHALEDRGERGWSIAIGLNSDSSVRLNKGPHRPLNSLVDRIKVLEGMWMVDEILVFEERTPINLIETIKPDALAKGGDYKGQYIVGHERVNQILFGPYLEGRSTSRLIELSYRADHRCDNCKGTGEVDRVSEALRFTPNDPHNKTCTTCQGRGYV